MNARHLVAVVIASVLGIATVASASDLSVNPGQVYLSPTAPTALLSVSNKSDQPLRVQLSAFQWKQADRDQTRLTPTDDVMFFPAFVELAPGEEREIRIGAGTSFGISEKTYRLVVQELSSAGEPVMSIPVFLKASRQLMAASVHGIRVEGDQLSINVENRGATHFVVDRVVVHALAQDGESLFDREVSGGYVLAGRVQTYDLPLPEIGCAEIAAISLEIRIGKNVLRDTIEGSSLMCAR